MKKLIVLLSGVFLALAGCSSSSNNATSASEDSTKKVEAPAITIGLTYIPDVQFAPMYVAEDQGYFKDAGLNVTLRHHGAKESLLGALQEGEEDVVFAGGDEMMQARSTGIDVVNWATLYQNYPVSLIVPKDSSITSWADMEGKKVGLPGPYGENYFGLLAAQREFNLEGKLEAVYIGYTQVTALQKGEVDGVIGFANNDSVALENAGMAVRALPISEKSVPLVGVGLGSMADAIDVDTYAKVLDALEKAYQFAVDNPEKTLDITQKYVPSLSEAAQRDTAAKVLDATLKLYGGGSTFGEQNAEKWEAMSQLFAEVGITESVVPSKEAFTNDVVAARTSQAS